MTLRLSALPFYPLAIGFAGAIAMASAMGFGRFSYTPILPGMMASVPLSVADAGLIASGNFAGYFVGALLAAYGWAAGRERPVALAGLLATAALLAAMALTTSVAAFVAIRFLAGVASAFTMIFTSSIVLGYAASAGKDYIQSLHYGGVGLGIALSSVMVRVVREISGGREIGWRLDWLAGAVFVFLSLVVVWWLLPKAPQSAARPAAEPKLQWNRPLALMTVSYGLFGFGYVITATFLVTIARMADSGLNIGFLSWFVAGSAAAVSMFLWKPVVARFGLTATYIAGLGVEAAGVLASVMLAPAIAPIVGGLLFGMTFIMITGYGLQIGRRLAPDSPRRAFAFMTAAFGIGQILGPVVAGKIAEITGDFTMPTVLAAAVLVVCMLLAVPVMRHVR